MLLLASDRKPGGNKTVLIALPIKDFKQYLWCRMTIPAKCVAVGFLWQLLRGGAEFCGLLRVGISEKYYVVGYDAM
jgi:hypothetical protein